MAETRKFSIHPEIIFSLIKAQAGTLGKAVAECVMNSIDAFADRIDIRFDAHTLIVKDNGQGFRDRDEVLAWFEVLGFPHDEGNHRRFGKFGMGRAQLWSFASTVWRTNDFELDVNIKERGLDYELRELVQPSPGLTIEGQFYEPLGLAGVQNFEREVVDLVRFAPAKIYLNGKLISLDPAKEEWTTETEQFWMKLEESRSGHLVVYNQGVLVCHMHAGRHRVSGVVCTKPGYPLELNMARNMVLESQCKVWRRIAAHFPDTSEPRKKAAIERPSEHALADEIALYLKKDKPSADEIIEFFSIPTLTTVAGRWTSLSGAFSYNSPKVVCAAPKGDTLGKLAQTRKLALVLDKKSMARFGATNVEEFGKTLIDFVNRVDEEDAGQWTVRHLRETLPRITWANDVPTALPELENECEVLGDKDLDEMEKTALNALGRIKWDLRRLTNTSAPTGSKWADPNWMRLLDLYVGTSPTRKAWTDGSTRLVFERKTFGKLVREGISGWCALLRLYAIEYLHDQSSFARKEHGADERQLLNVLSEQPEFYDLALRSCYYFARSHRSDKPFAKRMLKELDDMVTLAPATVATTATTGSSAAPAATPVVGASPPVPTMAA
jgi:hypothetical protein